MPLPAAIGSFLCDSTALLSLFTPVEVHTHADAAPTLRFCCMLLLEAVCCCRSLMEAVRRCRLLQEAMVDAGRYRKHTSAIQRSSSFDSHRTAAACLAASSPAETVPVCPLLLFDR